MFKSPVTNLKGVCGVHTGAHQHQHPHQVFMNELMREYDPNDPMNEFRTFDKMVAAANKKHLNPGEQSFHYYVGEDKKVHGFVAIGNINDRLPHIIITETGSDSPIMNKIDHINDLIYNFDLDYINNALDNFYKVATGLESMSKWWVFEADESIPG